MAKTVSEHWTTSLGVADLAAWFKETAQDRNENTGRFAKMVARGKGIEFFTPETAGDPFAAIEDQPAFSVGVTMPRGGGFRGQAEIVTLHMYVFDDGERRTVQLTTPVASAMDQFQSGRVGGVGHSAGGAKRFLRHFADMLKQRDPDARETG